MTGQSFTPREIVAVMIVGVVGVLIPGLQPQLLGALAASGRISTSAIGPLATIELLAMGLAAGGAGAFLAKRGVRTIAICALIVSALCDVMTPAAVGGEVFALRAVAGLAEGAAIWLAIGFIIRSSGPERWSGLYLGIQTAAQFALASVIAAVIIGQANASGFLLLAAVTIAALAAVPLLPSRFAPIETGESGQPPIPARGWIALAGIVLYLAAVVAIWVYIEPLGLHRALDAHSVRIVAPLALGMQVLGALTAAVLAERMPAAMTLASAAIVTILLFALFAVTPSSMLFILGAAIFGFLWLFAMPFQIPLVMAADPSRRAALMIGGAQLIGSSLGPLGAGLLVSGNDVSPVPILAAASMIGGALLLLLAGRARAIS
jgi:MFS transporter, DHA1 family, inner membrane transport protein